MFVSLCQKFEPIMNLLCECGMNKMKRKLSDNYLIFIFCVLKWHCNEPLERVLTIEKFTQVKQRREVWKNMLRNKISSYILDWEPNKTEVNLYEWRYFLFSVLPMLIVNTYILLRIWILDPRSPLYNSISSWNYEENQFCAGFHSYLV